MNLPRNTKIILLVILGGLLLGLTAYGIIRSSQTRDHFSAQRAYRDVLAQVSYGARIPGTQAHAETIAYIQEELEKAGWQTQIQQTQWAGFEIQNIIASRNNETPEIILGAHYDSRSLADRDPGPDCCTEPVPGANDGASGVAVLLELARSLPADSLPVWLVFFDAEDGGDLDGREWIMGSRAFVASLEFQPRAAIIVDMIGDADLNLYIERNSDAALVSAIWSQAAELGFEQQFIHDEKYSMLDDHTPFLEAGIPAVDIIDFDYPYWHTSADTPDKISPQSLYIVGETLRTWILEQK